MEELQLLSGLRLYEPNQTGISLQRIKQSLNSVLAFAMAIWQQFSKFYATSFLPSIY